MVILWHSLNTVFICKNLLFLAVVLHEWLCNWPVIVAIIGDTSSFTSLNIIRKSRNQNMLKKSNSMIKARLWTKVLWIYNVYTDVKAYFHITYNHCYYLASIASVWFAFLNLQTTGSLYFWAAHLAGPKWGPFASWCCAWLETIGLIAGIGTQVWISIHNYFVVPPMERGKMF